MLNDMINLKLPLSIRFVWDEMKGVTHRFRNGVDDPGEADSVIELLLVGKEEKCRTETC